MKSTFLCNLPCSLPTISSKRDFLDAFSPSTCQYRLVLVFDDFSELQRAPTSVRDDFLRAFREISNNNSAYAVIIIVAAGILSTNLAFEHAQIDRYLSPFNHPYLTLDETKALFHEDHLILIY